MTEIACVVDGYDALGECCVWCPDTRKVWWLDILRPCVHSYDPTNREHRVYPLSGTHCGCLALRKSGGLVLALNNGLHAFDPNTGKLNFLCHAEPEEAGNRYNDGRCDRRGRLWIGTMDIDIRRASGSFYRIGADRSALRLFDGITVPNSIAFSPDDRTLYFADTPRRVIWAFDFNLHAGMIGERRVFAETTAQNGLPDGSCVDAEGFLWNAEYGGHRLTRYAPDGRLERTIDLPVTNPTCCCFGGEALDTLYVTSATVAPQPGRATPAAMEGGLLALDVGVRGLPEAAFGG
jgi:sugar lactone lactonase YvrE